MPAVTAKVISASRAAPAEISPVRAASQALTAAPVAQAALRRRELGQEFMHVGKRSDHALVPGADTDRDRAEEHPVVHSDLSKKGAEGGELPSSGLGWDASQRGARARGSGASDFPAGQQVPGSRRRVIGVAPGEKKW